MGGCASKTKVLKGDDAEAEAEAFAPAPSSPPPPPQMEEETLVKDVKEKEGLVTDDSSTKNSSLGNLFKEGEKETVTPSELPESSTKEVEKTILEDSAVKTEVERAPEVSPAPVAETSEEKKIEETIPEVVTPEEKNLEEIRTIVVQSEENLETSNEKSPEENKLKAPEEKKIKESTTALVVEAEEKFDTPKEKAEETPKQEEPTEVKVTAEKAEEYKTTAEEQLLDKSEQKS